MTLNYLFDEGEPRRGAPAREIDRNAITPTISPVTLDSNSSITQSVISNESIHSLYHRSNNIGTTPSFDILPSYQMHQSILNRPLSSNSVETMESLLPTYSDSSSQQELSYPSETILIDLQEGSVLNNIEALPTITSKKEVKISIQLDQCEQALFTNGDCLSGTVIIENATSVAIPFEMFYVTFDGEVKTSKGAVYEEKDFRVQNFLRMVDLGASWTDADASDYLEFDSRDNTFCGLARSRILAAKSKYKKHFSFKIPSSSLDHSCGYNISSHSQLPPTFGSHMLSQATNADPNVLQRFHYQDLTIPGYSINYSVNARLIVLSKTETPVYLLKSPQSYPIKFVPSQSKHDEDEEQKTHYEHFKTTPSYQLKMLASKIENNIREARTTIDAIDQDRRILVYERRGKYDDDDEINKQNIPDDSKRRNLYTESISSCSSVSSVAVDEFFTERHRKDYRYFRKKKIKPAGFFSGLKSYSSSTSSVSSSSCSSSSSYTHDTRDISFSDSDSGTLSISSGLNERLTIDFDKIRNPFNKKGSNISIPLSLDFNYIMPLPPSLSQSLSFSSSQLLDFAKYFPLEPDVDLIYINVTTKGIPVPLELDPDWFSSRAMFEQTVKSKFRRLSQEILKLPRGTTMFASTLQELKAMNQINFESGVLSRAISVKSVNKSNVEAHELDDKLSLESKMHLQLQLESNKVQSLMLVPDFQSCLVSRFYFLRLKFKTKPVFDENYEFDYDFQTNDVLQNLDGNYKFYLDVPISIKKMV